jgi:aryl-phospho-beta-D-glucosidase BglC (GH1 family)
VNPNLLIIVEGIGDNYWWGGNLSKAGTHPVVLNLPNRLVYSPHDYPRSVYDQSWFHALDYPQNLPALWDRHWGHLVRTDKAPVLLGEFGTRLQTESDRLWFDSIASYIEENELSFTFWCFNPNSTDTGGLLQDDWNSIHQNKQSVLGPLQFPLIR